MVAPPSVSLSDLEEALYWVSADGALENRALISRSTGAIHYASADGFVEEELPEDTDDPSHYWSVPHKNDFDLGRSLVFRFVSEELPDEYRTVQSFFHRRGAYSQFKALLQRRGQLDRWHDYEHRATEEALRQWAAECGFHVVDTPKKRAGA